MEKAQIARWVAVFLAGMVAVGIAVWAGLQARPPQQPEPIEDPAQVARGVCAQRLADVGRALSAYAADHGGSYPVTSTPAATYDELFPALAPYGVTEGQLLCPVSEESGCPPYVYHSYLSRGDVQWPKWMPEKHIVTVKSAAETWLLADALIKDETGPHSETQKAFNYLRVDGSVLYREGAPRMVYK